MIYKLKINTKKILLKKTQLNIAIFVFKSFLNYIIIPMVKWMIGKEALKYRKEYEEAYENTYTDSILVKIESILDEMPTIAKTTINEYSEEYKELLDIINDSCDTLGICIHESNKIITTIIIFIVLLIAGATISSVIMNFTLNLLPWELIISMIYKY